VRSGATDNTVVGNTVVGNNGPGIELLGAGTTGNSVRGNLVGVTAAGAIAANGGGVRVAGGASGNVVGGAGAADRNVIGGNLLYGLAFSDAGTQSNVAVGNYIGIDPGGLNARPNAIGVLFEGGAAGNTASTSTISGNGGDGVRIQGNGTNGNRVQANRIGVTPVGSALLPNAGDGIRITGGASGSVVGTLPPQANLIRGNAGAGIRVESGTGNDLSYNAIQGNGGLGIDLGPPGVTPNDPLDADNGANELLNSPLLSNVVQNGSMLSLTVAQSSGLPSTSIAAIVHAVSACDPSGRGEGDVPLDGVGFNTNASGNGSVSAMLPLPGPGAVAAVAATSLVASGSSSEFSPCAVPSGFVDLVYANGFEASLRAPLPPAPASVRQAAVPLAIERIDDTSARVILTVDGAQGRLTPARSLTLGSSAAVVVQRIDAQGMACELLGAVACEAPELHAGQSAQAVIVLGVARGDTEVWLETRDASGALGRTSLRIDAPLR
jgi:parallel beta-helix repeat protein